ncbi:MAG: DUF4476 domain-containing protein, partial [Chitinophagaceae bacterium]|nr:DUF4476 domain-containing protein [Chitinophagaceae bacterium]
AISATAQTITLTFNGANTNINYQVLLDGKSYYSNSSTYPRTTNVRKEVALTNQRLGNHKIVVYRLRSNSGTYRNGINTRTYGNAIYSKTFVLREGYDMNIRVNGNGRVSFSESDIENLSDQGNNEQNNIMAMSDVRFDQLLQSVRSKYLQSSKVTVERNAFLTRSNYFTTEQVSQLLSLISSEANKLALAKLAYPRVSDPTNFTQLYEVFTSENSKDEMNVFIRNNPNNNSNNNNNNGNWGNNNTKAPMANYQFNQLLQTINGQYNQGGKFNIISDAFSNNSNYFSTAQIRQMLSLINSESDRLSLAKLSYARVFDAANFPSLYDLLYNQASRNDLNNYVIQNGGTGTNVQSNTRTAIADYQFNQLLQNVNNQWNQAGKFDAINSAFNTNGNYFTTSQVRQLLSLVNSESDRLALAKLSYLRVTDPANFTTLYALLTSQASRTELNNYVIQNGGTGTTVQTTSRIQMSDALFNQLYQKASNHIRPSSTIADLREFFNNSSYNFSTAQIHKLLSLISSSLLSPLASETDLLEVAKLSWHRVTDPANFTQLFSLFTIQANRDALNAYIQARPY